MVLANGFEPSFSNLKDLRPRPLDDASIMSIRNINTGILAAFLFSCKLDHSPLTYPRFGADMISKVRYSFVPPNAVYLITFAFTLPTL